MSFRTTFLALVLIVLAVLCIPIALVFLFGGWMAQGSDGMLLLTCFGVGCVVIAIGVFVLRALRPR